MVLGNVRNLRVESTIMDSRSLKFGMDRILSNDTTSSNGKSEDFCNSVPPCAACIASLYRCCRTASTLGITNFYKNENHAYQSLRLFSNVSNPVPSNASENSQKANSIGNIPKRKKSWSRAVFSNLQRKGLEKRFQLQKYITKPDRRQLAATLGLTDAQVKVWFQNRRMKWRHARESSQTNSDVGGSSGLAFPVPNSSSQQNMDSESESEVDVQTIEN